MADNAEHVDFVTERGPGGFRRTRLTGLTDGRVMCCLCFDYFRRDQLHQVEPGVVEDVCQQCAAVDGSRP